MRRYHKAFPDLRVEIDDLVMGDDTAVLRFTMRGTDTGGRRTVPRPPGTDLDGIERNRPR